MIIKRLLLSELSLLSDYIKHVQFDFDPPLFERINKRSDVNTIESYALKLLTKGNVFTFLEQEIIVAIIAIYTNNSNDKEAYIPLLSVKKEFSGKGLATLLLERASNCAIENNMKVIYVKTWMGNKNAIALYKKNGYNIVKNDGFSLTLKKEI
jgi:ribosomal protein S18 acetylase RimI-like enzyme